MSLQELYELAGSNYNEVVSFLPESMLPKLLKMFLEDESIQNLQEGIKNGDPETSFRAAHTLKGVTLNLHLNNLANSASELTEKLRDRKLENYQEEYQNTLKEYQIIIDAINNL